MKNGLEYFKHLHLVVQVVLAIGVLVSAIGAIALLIIVAINHGAEENLINLLLAVQSIALFSKSQKKNKPKR